MNTSSLPNKFAFAVGLSALAACGQVLVTGDIVDDRALFGASTRVEVSESGGFAALQTDWTVEQETGRYSMTRRHACAGAACPSALDSASGVLDRSTANSLFASIARDTTGLNAVDFGSTKNGADMIHYVLRVGANGDTHVDARADDGTMPPAMYRIIQAVHATVAAARK